MKTTTAGLTDTGLKRDGNEDSFATEESIGVFVVADGMGGHQAGEIASNVAVKVVLRNVRDWINKDISEDDIYDFPDSTLSKRGNYINSGIKLANRVIYEMSQVFTEYKGMGTTIVVLSVMGDSVIAANVGDSRIYLVREGSIEPLSKDHNMVAEQLEMGLITSEEAEVSPLRHVLTRNLGSVAEVEADVFEIEPRNNDRFLLCTDGLTDLVSDEKILEIVKGGEDPEQICKQLVSEANDGGGNDNITVSLVMIDAMENKQKGLTNKVTSFFKNNKH